MSFQDAPSALPLFYRSYSRRKPNGSRENWEDVVDRNLEGLVKLGKLNHVEKGLIRRQMLEQKALPSGRWLWVGGTDWSEDPKNFPGSYNCFQGDTLVTTKEFGAQPISTLSDRQVSVLTVDGEWSPVVFKSYGVQPLVELTLRRSSNRGGGGLLKRILVTPEHRWILEGGQSALTSELKSGDRLPFVLAPKPLGEGSTYRAGVQHGLIYGDGSIRGTNHHADRTNFKIRLCGEKRELLPYFDGRKTIYCPSYNGDPLVFVDAVDFLDFVEDGNLKLLPYTNNNEYLLGFLRGLMAADGSVCLKNGSSPTTLITGSRGTCEWVETIAPSLGFEVNQIRCMHPAGSVNNFGVRKNDLCSLTFCGESISDADLLRGSHKANFALKAETKFYWKVLNVEPLEESEEVFCCEEPQTHSFVLAGGILTGNCSSTQVDCPEAFGYLMDLAMQGCGTGAVLEHHVVAKLPPIYSAIEVEVIGEPGQARPERRRENTQTIALGDNSYLMVVGDSRQGWVDAYTLLIAFAMTESETGETIKFRIDVRGVRPAGEKLQGFGGVANPIKLPGLFSRVATILSKAKGRQLTPLECCLLIDEAALVVVAGNVRRSAGMRQFSSDDDEAAIAKANLWQQDENGDWRIDPERDALRMANHTRVFHRRPSYEEVLEAVTKQYHSGEGAIQFAPEAIARGNADLFGSFSKRYFIDQYCKSPERGRRFLEDAMINKDMIITEKEVNHRLSRYGLNPCLAGETGVWVQQGEDDLVSTGLRRIDSLLDLKDVRVPDGNGDWVPVVFECTDPAAEIWELRYQVVSELMTSEEVVRTTGNHAFFLAASNTPIEVQDLRTGDRLRHSTVFGDKVNSITVLSVRKTESIEPVYCCQVPTTHSFDLQYLHSHNCGEIVLNDNFCNLAEVHLNLIDPSDLDGQRDAFKAAALCVAALLNHRFPIERYQYSREIDPIVGVSFTGLFDFFVKALGIEWLRWWEAGRPEFWGDETIVFSHPLMKLGKLGRTDFVDSADFFRACEKAYLSWWKEIVEQEVWRYCDRHNLRRPNRCTTVQPAGCLTRDALRVFDTGLYYADEHLQEGGGDVDISEYNLSVREGIAVNYAIANEPQNLIRVTLENGRQITMTPDHRLDVGGQWIRAQDLEVGQILTHKIGVYHNAKEAKLEYAEVEYGLTGRQPRGCQLPPEMSPALAYFIGSLYGNGHNSERCYRTRFTHGNIKQLERLSQIAVVLFGLEGVYSKDARGGRTELCFGNKQLYRWLHLNGLAKTSASKDLERIPLKIRESSRESILAFFAGLIDTDGCIKESGSVCIDSASESFVRSLQQIGEAVGLCFSIYTNTEGKNWQQGEKSMFGISLSRMKSNKDSIAFLNRYSIKAIARPIPDCKRAFKFEPFRITKIETNIIDYTYDYSVEAESDDDSWYWQGAVKSHNSKSLLTNASPGWHPPKAQRFIRRMTFRRNDPIARACMDYGYTVVPSQSDKDDSGRLLDDPFDPRCTEWLVEIPTEVAWADLPGADAIDISQFSAIAQFDFYMQVQKFYAAHNCFSRDTKFLTSEGIKSFEDYEVGDTVIVLNADGDWVPADVVNTGSERPMLAITIREEKTSKEKTIVSTHCHRFPVRRASGGNSTIKVMEAKDLKIGHRLVLNFADLPSLDEDGIRHGIVFGDGSLYRDKKGDYSGGQLYLCGGKRHLQSYFKGFERTYERDELDQTRIYGLPVEWKFLPSRNSSQSYIAGFIAGLLATDGNIHRSTISISTGRQEVVDFLVQQAPRLGIKVSGYRWFESNGYKEKGGSFEVRFSKVTFPENLILRPHHLDHFRSHESQPCQWRIVDITDAEPQVGWCVMEPMTNHFTLSENILVMNTSATIEYREHEIEPLAHQISEAIRTDTGYISVALLARFDANETFPRLPFEPITRTQYQELSKAVRDRRVRDFTAALNVYSLGMTEDDASEQGPAHCDSDKCLIG
ncbi:LAGLIDADG family homing endonuclease [Synechococcus elongatus IITB4]|uniref:LAGLIDADG family homing endonuclease n=1 Tax=Synechococcus elongatus TaxID=32046 RepID=UPI0030CE1C00